MRVVFTGVLAAVLLVLSTLAIEGRLRRGGEAKTLATTVHDRRSQAAVSAAFGATVVAVALGIAGAVAGAAETPAAAWVGIGGLLLMVAGLIIRLAAMRTLGRFYTRTLRLTVGHEVVDSGPYRYVRHPGYLGMILLLGGAAFATASWAALVVGPPIVIAMYTVRMNAEETMLRAELGHAYDEYARRTRRLIPFLY